MNVLQLGDVVQAELFTGGDRSMQGAHSTQSSFFGMVYDELVPPEHLLRRIAATVDFAFVSELVRDCYCPANGRPSWDPLVW